MKILRREPIALLLTLILLAASSASPSEAEQSDYKLSAASRLEEPASHTLRVLFIGNSYTYVNNLPSLVTALAESAHESLETEMIVAPGATLKKHWEDGKAVEAMKRSRWDYVILQEQSTLGLVSQGGPPINNPKTFHEYARLFNSEIKSAGARTIFFLTWARQNLPETQAVLNSAYFTIAKELNAIVTPVGIAWQTALKKNPGVALHQKDLSHPTPAGSYLAACVLYSTLYGQSAAGLTGRVVGNTVDLAGRVLDTHGEQGGAANQTKGELVNLSKADSTFLQKVAWQTVSDENRHRH
ncbi:MAG TPA: hypothetical protein VGV87_11595 [Blastocatellia bacterium]|nr:hypothetical protein [Blastocatellia bacterium]